MSLKHTEQTDRLMRAVLALETEDECYRFMEDICTIQEILIFAQRLEVARTLDGGGSYQQTIAKTGASSATISRVNRSLRYGADGYAIAFERLDAEKEE